MSIGFFINRGTKIVDRACMIFGTETSVTFFGIADFCFTVCLLMADPTAAVASNARSRVEATTAPAAATSAPVAAARKRRKTPCAAQAPAASAVTRAPSTTPAPDQTLSRSDPPSEPLVTALERLATTIDYTIRPVKMCATLTGAQHHPPGARAGPIHAHYMRGSQHAQAPKMHLKRACASGSAW